MRSFGVVRRWNTLYKLRAGSGLEMWSPHLWVIYTLALALPDCHELPEVEMYEYKSAT